MFGRKQRGHRWTVPALAIGLALGFPALTATADASSSIHLTMWQQWGGGHEEQELKTAIAQYEKLHPNITITETPVSNNAKILAAITGGNPPDIIDMGTSGPLGGWASSGAIEPLASFIKASHLNLKQYVQSGLSAVTVNGQIYGLPFMNFLSGLIYNKKLFTAAGLNPNDPPTTIAQFDTDAAKMTKIGAGGVIKQMGFIPNYPGPSQGQICPLESYGWLFGGSWFSKAGAPTPVSPQTIAALNWQKSFYDKYGKTQVANFVQSAGAYLTSGDPFESGKVAMTFDGPWIIQYVKANNSALAPYLGVAKFPAPASAAGDSGTTYVDTNAQVIPKGSKNAQAAFDFIEWETTNPGLTSEFANTVANLPQLNNVPSFPLEKDPKFRIFIAEAKASTAHTWSQSSISSQYSTEICQAQDSALIGGKSAASALQQLATAIKD